MSLNERILPVILGLVCLLAAAGLIPDPTGADNSPVESRTLPVYYNEDLFFSTTNRHAAKNLRNAECSQTRVALMPHHDLASEYIAELFEKLAGEVSPETIVIIGPNHTNAGTAPVYSSTLNWMAPDGLVEPDTKTITRLVTTGLVELDDTIMEHEHAAFVPIPFIKRYFPKAKIVPLIISAEQTNAGSFKLAEAVADVADKKTLVLASIDFSHYLSSSYSRINDVKTRQLMLSKNYDGLAKLNNDYVDSPQSLVTMLKISELLKTPDMNILANINSGDLLHREVLSSTSYFTACFTP